MCGCCCKRVGIFKETGIYFPYDVDENGVCEMLENNKCKVYDNRPLLCNIEKLANVAKIDKYIFFKENIKVCNKMMDEDNMPLEYRII
jgi:Fe-S-cluster containining protein